MIRFIVKRDGRKVSFNQQKIANAIKKALVSVHPDEDVTPQDEELVVQLTDEVINAIESEVTKVPTVEHTQDLIEKILIKHDLADEAKNFILYRQQRTNVRTYNAELTQIYRDLTSKSTDDMDLKRENANIDANAPMGLMLRFGSEGSKDFVKRYVFRIAFCNRFFTQHHFQAALYFLQIDIQTLQQTYSFSFPFAKNPQQQMFRTDIRVSQPVGFLFAVCDNVSHSFCKLVIHIM